MSTIIPVIESIVDSSIDEVSLTNSTDTAPSSSVVKKAIDDINSDLSTINTDLSNVKDTINDIGDPDNIIYNNDVVTANNSTKKISTVLSPNNESRILLSNSAFQVLSRNNNADAGIEIQPGLLYLYFMRMNPLSNYGLSLSNTGLLFRDVNNNTDILSVSPTVFKYNNKNVLTDGSGLLYNNTVVTAGNDPISINQVNTNTGNNSEINISNPYISLINVSNNNSNNIYLHPDKIELFSKDENYRHSFILNTDGISFRDDDNNIDVFTVSPTSIKYNDKDVLLSNNANII
jgi:hypothetical protein